MRNIILLGLTTKKSLLRKESTTVAVKCAGHSAMSLGLALLDALRSSWAYLDVIKYVEQWLLLIILKV